MKKNNNKFKKKNNNVNVNFINMIIIAPLIMLIVK